jgi:hypothetical protein
MNASEGTNSSAKDGASRHVCHSNEGRGGCIPVYRRVAVVGKRESTWGVSTREPDDLVLHLVEREGMTVVNVGEKLYVRLLVVEMATLCS